MIYSPFDIVIVPFPFSDHLQKYKYRPALVISGNEYNKKTGCTVFLMITSALHSEFWNDYKIKDYTGTNLQGGCVIRPKIFTLDNSLIKTKLGKLGSEDSVNIKEILGQVLSI